jgi:hypothetical protein
MTDPTDRSEPSLYAAEKPVDVDWDTVEAILKAARAQPEKSGQAGRILLKHLMKLNPDVQRASEGYGVYNSKTFAALCKLPAVREFLRND